MTFRWLVLDLSAPLIAFGGVAVDQVGPTREFPAASMLTGLLANALGWRWSEREAHQALQDRLLFGACIAREGRVIEDVQNAKLEKGDRGWTTFGAPEGRDGASFDAPHRRQRRYLADVRALVVLRLTPPGESPDDEALAAALDRPARPLYLGRKPCLPSRPLRLGRVEGADAHEALRAALAMAGGIRPARAQWPRGQGPDGERAFDLADLRDWRTGLHGGARPVVEGFLSDAAP